eukprot:scaffold12403_cov148-Cylindrotheca_fusiformis.AAC.4
MNAEDEAALLAEMRAISNKSAGSRFQDDTYNDDGPPSPPTATTNGPEVAKEPLEMMNRPTSSATPATAPSPMGAGGNSSNFQPESTSFSGVNGGEANDAELLALLRGVSAKSASADRFADDDENNIDATTQPAPAPVPTSSPPPKKTTSPVRRSRRDPNEVPPWKQKRVANKENTNNTTTAAPTAPVMGGGNFKQESTFSGVNGGEANDEELLALLRGVSAKSSSADRFADDGEEPVPAPTPAPVAPKPKPTLSSRAPRQQPKPAPVPAAPAPPMGGGNFKQESTFSGENGGEANDEELLALLRGVSAKSSSADRFADDGEEPVRAPAPTPVAPKPKPTLSSRAPRQQPKPAPVPAAPAPAPPMGGGNFKQESTFSGENGGEANDEELLALLRGVSAKSSSADRFTEDDEAPIPAPAPAPVAPKPKPTLSSRAPRQQPKPAPVPAAPAPAPPMGGGNFKQESTFSGENGGEANDEELLALLRGVSAKSSSADRFADDGEEPFRAPAPTP